MAVLYKSNDFGGGGGGNTIQAEIIDIATEKSAQSKASKGIEQKNG